LIFLLDEGDRLVVCCDGYSNLAQLEMF